MIKKYIILLMSSVFVLSSCLKEDPPFDNSLVLNTTEGLITSTNGVFAAVAADKYMGNDYFSVINLNSGLIMSGSVTDQGSISGLNLASNQKNVENLWQGMYTAINRTNTVIDAWQSKETELDETQALELAQNYFVRSFTYFNIVRLWGKAPLRISEASVETLNQPKALRTDIYGQIIKDAKKSLELYAKANGQTTIGRPTEYAVHMLLAKVYLAMYYGDNELALLNQESVFKNAADYTDMPSDATEALNMAKDEAELVEGGGFSLVQNYEDLWMETNGNTKESIFEIQYNIENSFEGRLWNIKDSYKGAAGWSRMNINPEIIDQFVYANTDHKDHDGKIIKVNGAGGRYFSTFRTHYQKKYGTPAEKTEKVYPEKQIGGNPKTYASIFKYSIKNLEHTNASSNQNMIIYRYADLKLMMAEIGIQLGDVAVGGKTPLEHVNDLLTRSRESSTGDGVNPIALTALDINELYYQYRYEELGEGQDWFRSRRLGSTWFKENVIDPHNGLSLGAGVQHVGVDRFYVEFPEDRLERVMLLPIPATEINTNQEITLADQNPGY